MRVGDEQPPPGNTVQQSLAFVLTADVLAEQISPRLVGLVISRCGPELALRFFEKKLQMQGGLSRNFFFSHSNHWEIF